MQLRSPLHQRFPSCKFICCCFHVIVTALTANFQLFALIIYGFEAVLFSTNIISVLERTQIGGLRMVIKGIQEGLMEIEKIQ